MDRQLTEEELLKLKPGDVLWYDYDENGSLYEVKVMRVSKKSVRFEFTSDETEIVLQKKSHYFVHGLRLKTSSKKPTVEGKNTGSDKRSLQRTASGRAKKKSRTGGIQKSCTGGNKKTATDRAKNKTTQVSTAAKLDMLEKTRLLVVKKRTSEEAVEERRLLQAEQVELDRITAAQQAREQDVARARNLRDGGAISEAEVCCWNVM